MEEKKISTEEKVGSVKQEIPEGETTISQEEAKHLEEEEGVETRED